MGVYLHAKFEVSSIILTGFRWGVIPPPQPQNEPLKSPPRSGLKAKFLGSDVLFCFISACNFGNLKNPFATIISLSELNCRFRKFILFIQMKKVISMNYGSNTSSWNLWRWVRLDLIFMTRDIYNQKGISINTNHSSCQHSSPKVSLN